jgi:hypothetical protein
MENSKIQRREVRKMEIAAVAAVAIVAIAVIVFFYLGRRPQPPPLALQAFGDPAGDFRGVVERLASSGPLEARLEVQGGAGACETPPRWREYFSRPRQ